MKPIQVSIHVPHPREQVFDFLAISANHEAFNRHMMTDWSFAGPPSGIGSITHATATLGGRSEPVDIEVIEDARPERIVERNVGASGKRVATGTYELAADASGTTVTFVYTWQSIPVAERLSGPIVRKIMRSALEASLRQLAEVLETHLPRRVETPNP